MNRPFKLVTIAFLLLVASASLALESTSQFQGTFTAQAGRSQVFRGRWTAAVATANPNFAQGYWTLLNDFHQVSLEGSWTLKKTGARWRGTWTAHVQNGASISGTWDADISVEKDATLAGMLKRTFANEVSGSWASGRFAGFWWLDGEKSESRAPEPPAMSAALPRYLSHLQASESQFQLCYIDFRNPPWPQPPLA